MFLPLLMYNKLWRALMCWHGHRGSTALEHMDDVASSNLNLGTFSSWQVIDGVLQQLSTVLNCYNGWMEAAVAGFALRHPEREWRRTCSAPSCVTTDCPLV